MAKYTKKWQNDFEKRYSKTMKDLDSLEKEFKEMCDSNPDSYISAYPKTDTVYFNEVDRCSCDHYAPGEDENNMLEYIGVLLSTKLGSFEFQLSNFEQIIEFRNSLIKACDKFKRPEENTPKEIIDECQEYSDVSDEEWEQMEDKEWTVRVTRPCTQSWTLTVMAKNSCEAEKKARMGEPEEDVRHDENDDFDNYGPEDFECID